MIRVVLVDDQELVRAGFRLICDALLAPAVTSRLLSRFLRLPPPSTGVPSELAELTDRERDVLALLARGQSNAGIAASLVLGEAP